uniref:mitochondrial fission regulator 2-like n=1 Tax=Monopterus albus TaxID=43700 RepID=UPI0009B4E3B5|nr:mitochondrial fission regulator 2-like [Monopterus albus]
MSCVQTRSTGVERSDLKGRSRMSYKFACWVRTLTDLNTTVQKAFNILSPGGTPLRRHSKGGTALINDPAALIAEALKRKFAHHRHNISSDKENSRELSPFGSPDTPKVPHHARRSQGHRHLIPH